jgi:alanyl-tRNA synthetase
MTAKELKERYLGFFKNRGHAVIPSAPLIPENDPSALFISAGMQPLVPYLLGETHPKGKRLTDVQICLRTTDVDMVGDNRHHTFFEMLGNWSLGDYWKKESLAWSFEFLTKELDLASEKIWVTCFEGDKDAPKDTESAEIWKSLGIPDSRIVFLPKEDNWWGPAGETGPCGPDSEMYFEIINKPHGPDCHPGDGCGRFTEIWNNVFMQYNKTKEGKFEVLKQKNVDTGMGVDRTTAVLSGLSDNYKVKDLWGEIILAIEEISKETYEGNEKSQRVIADHIRAATFIAAEDILPANKAQGYVLRRLIRRAVRYGKNLKIEKPFIADVAGAVINNYGNNYPRLKEQEKIIKNVLSEEENKFNQTLSRGLKEIERLTKLSGKNAFFLYETYGFPLELTEEIAQERGQKVDKEVFEKEFQKHKSLSKSASAGMFKGGLADASEEATKLHTVTHLLHQSLRLVLGEQVSQKGSNITVERLRFDFSYSEKLTEEEIKKVGDLVNEQIDKKLPVNFETMLLTEAKEKGALAFFGEKYPDEVKVYSIGSFSKEVCGGPHVKNTNEIGRVKIIKQEKVGAGVMRIYASILK